MNQSISEIFKSACSTIIVLYSLVYSKQNVFCQNWSLDGDWLGAFLECWNVGHLTVSPEAQICINFLKPPWGKRKLGSQAYGILGVTTPRKELKLLFHSAKRRWDRWHKTYVRWDRSKRHVSEQRMLSNTIVAWSLEQLFKVFQWRRYLSFGSSGV